MKKEKKCESMEVRKDKVEENEETNVKKCRRKSKDREIGSGERKKRGKKRDRFYFFLSKAHCPPHVHRLLSAQGPCFLSPMPHWSIASALLWIQSQIS